MRRASLLVPIVAYILSNSCAAQPATSQRELNGFLLGQSQRAIDASFGTLLAQQRTDDGWTERIYSLDSSYHAFMSFGFPDSTGECLSIQIAGAPGTPMSPFAGLMLGDPRSEVLHLLGSTPAVEHEQDGNLDLLTYPNRNYSVELDSLGRLFSIRLVGYDGFPKRPSTPVDNLTAVGRTLRSHSIDSLIGIISPEFEVSIGDTVLTFGHGARIDLSDSGSRISRFLYNGDSSLLNLLASTPAQNAELKLRLFERHRTGYVYVFPSNSKLREIVFVADSGKWRIYEISVTK